jgi:hypothetical protein
MKRILSAMVATSMLFVFTAAPAHAASGKFKDGGYSSESTDSSTCGGDWAQDAYVRKFVVTIPQDLNGPYAVTERFVKGKFITFAGTSPGACNLGPDNGSTVNAGVKGKFKGSYDMTVSDGVLNRNGSCVLDAGQCTTAGWVEGFFGPSATYTIDVFHFTYNAKHQGLVGHQWINSSDAGNSGDINNA